MAIKQTNTHRTVNMDTVIFKKYRNKLTSSIRTSKAIYFSEAIKSGNNVGEL
jgi:hypothetical protein